MDDKLKCPPEAATTSVFDEDERNLPLLSLTTNSTSRPTTESPRHYAIFNNNSPSRTDQNNIRYQSASPRKTSIARPRAVSGTKPIEFYFSPSPKAIVTPPRPAYLPSTSLTKTPRPPSHAHPPMNIVLPQTSYVEVVSPVRQNGKNSTTPSSLLSPFVEKDDGEVQARAEKRRRLSISRMTEIEASMPSTNHQVYINLEPQSNRSTSPYEILKMELDTLYQEPAIVETRTSQPATSVFRSSPFPKSPRRFTTPPLAITEDTPPQSPMKDCDEMSISSVMPLMPQHSNLESIDETIYRNRMEFEQDHFGRNYGDDENMLLSEDSELLDEYDPYFDTFDVCSIVIWLRFRPRKRVLCQRVGNPLQLISLRLHALFPSQPLSFPLFRWHMSS
jgi:hypothetical protein